LGERVKELQAENASLRQKMSRRDQEWVTKFLRMNVPRWKKHVQRAPQVNLSTRLGIARGGAQEQHQVRVVDGAQPD